MTRVYLSIGSNIERERHIRSAHGALTRLFGELTVSPVYESEAVGFEGDHFYNLVVGFDTEMSLAQLDDTLHAIEAEHGRTRGEQKFRPRTLDLDLLLYGELIDHQGHDIPRGEITEYAFVLLPLSEIAGDARHPESGRRYRELWRDFSDPSQRLWRVDWSPTGS